MNNYFILVQVKAKQIRIPSYRIWINNELILERSFWPDSTTKLIEELMAVELESNIQNTLVLEQINQDDGNIWINKVSILTINKNMIKETTFGETDLKYQSYSFMINT